MCLYVVANNQRNFSHKEWQLPERGDRGRRVPFNVDPTSEGVGYRRVNLNRGLFTRRVSDDGLFLRFHARRFRRFGLRRQSPNCRI